MPPPLRSRLTVLAAACGAAAALPAAASAHAFLVRSVPEAGSRLAKPPTLLRLEFSEPFVPGSEHVAIQRTGGAAVSLPTVRAAGAAIVQPLPAHLRGVFVVSWRVLSDDGHVSLGQFAFALGSTAALPAVSGSSEQTSWTEVVASWLVLVGLCLSLGGLLSERVVWRRMPREPSVMPAPARAGIALAAVGALLELVLLSGGRTGGGIASGLHGRALAEAIATRPGELSLAILVALALATLQARADRLRLGAVLPLLAAVVFHAARGHSGTSPDGWAVAADAVHLAAVATWLGGLAHLVLIVARAKEPRPAVVAGVRRYAGLALPTVALILATGVLTAVPEFRSVGAVVSSGYGRTLLIKAALVGLALLLALTARPGALAAGPMLRLSRLRRLTLAESTTLAAVLAAAAVLANAAPPRAVPAASAANTLGPPPVAGPAVRLADLAGQLLVAVTAGAHELRFTVLPPGEEQSGTLTLAAAARRPDGTAVDLDARSCGAGCFSIPFRLAQGVTQVTATAGSSAWKGGTVRFAVRWPPGRERSALLRRIAATMSSVRSLALTESVTSGFGSATGTEGDYRLSGRQFMQTEAFGGGAVDVRTLGTRAGSTELSFAVPGSNIWYRLWVDRRLRLRRELILDPGHRIFRTFRYARR